MSAKNSAPSRSCQPNRRFRRGVAKKNLKFLDDPTDDEHDSAQLETLVCGASPASTVTKARECSMDFEQQFGMTSNSVDRLEEGMGSMSTETADKVSQNICTMGMRPVYIIEGSKALIVNARPWPKRVHKSVIATYNDPSPKLTTNEIKKQKSLVNRMRTIATELSQERFRRKCVLLSSGIYCLPKSLILQSKARLVKWYLSDSESQCASRGAIDEGK